MIPWYRHSEGSIPFYGERIALSVHRGPRSEGNSRRQLVEFQEPEVSAFQPPSASKGRERREHARRAFEGAFGEIPDMRLLGKPLSTLSSYDVTFD